MSATGRTARRDITGRADLAVLVDTFYSRVRGDDRLGPIFDDVAHVDWAVHLPRMYDFWETVLFGRPVFKGQPPVVHRALAQQVALPADLFDHWVALFCGTVDDLFAGPWADAIKQRAGQIALALQLHLEADSGSPRPALSTRAPET
jgi:hemoglobin